jgi:hypothetical protein
MRITQVAQQGMICSMDPEEQNWKQMRNEPGMRTDTWSWFPLLVNGAKCTIASIVGNFCSTVSFCVCDVSDIEAVHATARYEVGRQSKTIRRSRSKERDGSFLGFGLRVVVVPKLRRQRQIMRWLSTKSARWVGECEGNYHYLQNWNVLLPNSLLVSILKTIKKTRRNSCLFGALESSEVSRSTRYTR